jgi:ribonuclease HI
LKDEFVTIYSDASFCPNQKIMGWAFYSRCSSGKMKKYGLLNEKTNCSTTAEMEAILIAVKRTIRRWPHLKGVFVNCDSLTSCELLWPSNLKETDHYNLPRAQKIKDEIISLLESKGMWLRVKHVKGHQVSDNVRSYLNNFCDKKAKEKLLKASS